MRGSHERDCVRRPPSVGVKQRDRMQEDVFILGLVEQSYMQSVEIDVPVSEHHAFGIGAGPAGIEKFAERILVKRGNFRAVRRRGGQELFVVLRSKPVRLRSRIEQVVGADAGQFRTKGIDKTNEILSPKTTWSRQNRSGCRQVHETRDGN